MHLLPRLGRLAQLHALRWYLPSERVPPEFGRLTSLTRLPLALEGYPATARSLQQLSSLTGLQDLLLAWAPSAGRAQPGGAPLEFLTPAFSNLNHLTLWFAGLTALPPAVTVLEQLTHLDLSRSQAAWRGSSTCPTYAGCPFVGAVCAACPPS